MLKGMNSSERQLLVLRRVISEMEQEDIDSVSVYKAKLDAVLQEGGDIALIAFGVLVLEHEIKIKG